MAADAVVNGPRRLELFHLAGGNLLDELVAKRHLSYIVDHNALMPFVSWMAALAQIYSTMKFLKLLADMQQFSPFSKRFDRRIFRPRR